MRIFLLVFFSIISVFGCLRSQTLTGKVVDSKTKEPIHEVSVYLNGTSFHANTGEDGVFTISMNKKINTDLIIAHMGYNLVSIPNPFNHVLDTIYLTEKENLLEEVSVLADKKPLRWKLNMFKENFLGKTKGGRSCQIINEEDIELYYNSEGNRLLASSKKPLIIENKHLGYVIYFNLIDFQIEYLGDPNLKIMKKAAYFGTSLFKDIKPDDQKIKKHREDTYIDSRMYFFKNFAEDSLKKANYIITNSGGKNIQVSDYFSITDTLSLKKVSILPLVRLPSPHDEDDWKIPNALASHSEYEDDRYRYGFIYVYRKKKIASSLTFYTNFFWVDSFGNLVPLDEYGNVDSSYSLSFHGALGKRLVGDLLPMNYEP